MKVDKWFFDAKKRYYDFYLCIQRWIFMLAFSIKNWGFEISFGRFYSDKELLENE